MAASTAAERFDKRETVRVNEICDRLGIHTNTGYKWIREDRFPIPVKRMGKYYFATRADVEAFFHGGAAA